MEIQVPVEDLYLLKNPWAPNRTLYFLLLNLLFFLVPISGLASPYPHHAENRGAFQSPSSPSSLAFIWPQN